jgi:hypothetical protein
VEEFVGFEFLLLDASQGAGTKVRIIERGPRRERVDLIARQFRDFFEQGDPRDTSPRGMLLTHDFKVSREVGKTAGWLTFLIDRGNGKEESLEEVALVVFARSDDDDARRALRRLEPYISLPSLPSPPLVVAVKLAPKVPAIVSEWYGRSVATFFAQNA